jgi:mRNA-degrading endonuclease YafQ of YafQ-DinJ toxin-antitoxin module
MRAGEREGCHLMHFMVQSRHEHAAVARSLNKGGKQLELEVVEELILCLLKEVRLHRGGLVQDHSLDESLRLTRDRHLHRRAISDEAIVDRHCPLTKRLIHI